MEPAEQDLRKLISVVDETFKKDDITKVPRKVLEELVIHLYDGINQVLGDYPDWWDRVD